MACSAICQAHAGGLLQLSAYNIITSGGQVGQVPAGIQFTIADPTDAAVRLQHLPAAWLVCTEACTVAACVCNPGFLCAAAASQLQAPCTLRQVEQRRIKPAPFASHQHLLEPSHKQALTLLCVPAADGANHPHDQLPGGCLASSARQLEHLRGQSQPSGQHEQHTHGPDFDRVHPERDCRPQHLH